MRKPLSLYKIIITCLLFLGPYLASAQFYTAGGEISYKFLYKTLGEFPTNHYQVTVKLYKECQVSDDLPPFDIELRCALANPPNVTPPYYPDHLFHVTVPMSNFYITKKDQNSCSPNQQPICYYVAEYTTQVGFLENWGEYLVYLQDDPRKTASFENVSTDGLGKLSGGVMGFTYTTRIPGMLNSPLPNAISSPVFKKDYPLILCAGQNFNYDFSALDPDGDSLSYQFVPAYQGKIWTVPRYPASATDPPFYLLTYYPGYDGAHPLGNNVTINPVTGMISGIAPARPGRYVVVVEVVKYHDGQVATRHRKEIQFIFSNCTWPRAQLDSTYKNCRGTTIHFTNYSTGVIKSYFWDFGDPTTGADTSGIANPIYHYPAPGTYQVKLYLNKGTSFCKDSATATVIVDSGLNASFNATRSIALCNEAVYDFTNTSGQGINPITKYAWDFGEPSVSNDLSATESPTYIYPTDGYKNVRLIISNDIGCSDTAFQLIQAFKSLMRAPNDTTICILDTIALQTNTNGYPGTFSWSPNYNISSLTAAAPLVHPQKDTTYYVSFTDATGCVAVDSVRVKVRDSVAIQILQADTTICRLDTIRIVSEHDGISVTWQPAASVVPVKADGSVVNASPFSTGMLIATAHFGSCFAEDTVNIKVVPRPQVTISNDTLVCLGAPVPLQATGGAYYLWSPAATLDNPVSAAPVAHPQANTVYSVSVYDTLGCPKHTIATVTVSTFRALYAMADKDTMVVMGEPVQLSGSGGMYYHWSPSLYLSDVNIPNPVARPMEDMIYWLKVSDDNHCADSAKVKIRAFKDPDIYVPSAFTPNNDGRNDLFKVFPVGFLLEELKIFDRWGNVVFVTNDYTKGWDGRFKGEIPASGVYVWVAHGRNKKTGAPVTKKGTVTLIR